MNQVATKPANPIELLHRDFTRIRPEVQKALPPHVKIDKFLRVAQTAVTNNPDLLGADRRSLFNAMTKAAADGLMPDGREAALTVFGKQAQYMPMVGGLLKLVRNSGQLQSLDILVVREGDQFDYWIDQDGTRLTHRPSLDESGNVTHVYAIARTTDGGRYIEVMSKSAIEKVRNVSRAKGSGPWVQWWEEMAKKTVLRRLIKRLPLSTDIDSDLLIRDPDDEPAPVHVVAEVVQDTPKGSKLDRFAAAAEPAADVIDGETGEVIEEQDTGATAP